MQKQRELVKQAYDIAGWGGTVQYDNYGNEGLRNIGGGLYDEGADVMAYIAAGDDIMTFEDYKKKKAMVQELALKKKKLENVNNAKQKRHVKKTKRKTNLKRRKRRRKRKSDNDG